MQTDNSSRVPTKAVTRPGQIRVTGLDGVDHVQSCPIDFLTNYVRESLLEYMTKKQWGSVTFRIELQDGWPKLVDCSESKSFTIQKK